QRLEAPELIARVVEAEGVDGGGQVVDELAAAGGLEVEHADDLLALEEQVVVEKVAVDDALRQLALEVVAKILDFVVERAHDAAKVRREAVADRRVELGDALEAEAVVDRLLVVPPDRVQLREDAAGVFELGEREPLRAHRLPVDPPVDRQALAPRLAVVAPLAVGDRLRAGKAVPAQEEQQLELPLDVELALHLVDAQQVTPPGGLEQVVRVDRSGGDAVGGEE